MRVLVCGGRDYVNYQHVKNVLSNLVDPPISLIINGGAAGADGLSSTWATENGIPFCVFPAHWSTMGLRAGPTRNDWMLVYGNPNLVVAFPGGKGTADMVRRANQLNIRVLEPK